MKKYPLITLIVLDGFGVARSGLGNAISQARMPFFQNALATYPVTTLQAAGESVGISWGEMGNSEVGHMNIGLGRVPYQDLPRINNAIQSGAFFENPSLLAAIQHVKKTGGKLHIVGILSDGGVHGVDEHVYQLLAFAAKQGLTEVFVHAILDGRDTSPKSGLQFLERFSTESRQIGCGTLATIAGRYFAMDRDNRWDRIERAYLAMTQGRGEKITDPLAAVQKQYAIGKTDEDMPPLVVTTETGRTVGQVQDHDAVIFTNYRNDRARQLTEAFVLPGFEKFNRGPARSDLVFVTMVEYEQGLPVLIAFPPLSQAHPLAEVLSQAGIPQIHIAETEKYAHVTSFFDGGILAPFPQEEFILVPSPSVATYDQEPEMSAYEVTDRAIRALNTGRYQFVVMNYANADMVGHTGNLQATISALEHVDKNLSEIVAATLSIGGLAIITGDHGNAEVMIDPVTGDISKEHTANPVPFVLIAHDLVHEIKPVDLATLSPAGILSDVAPTILELFSLPQPAEMTGKSLLTSLIHPIS